jgi:DNA polymerase
MLDSRAMIIGEAPGAKEDEEGLPFIGSAGKLLSEALEEALGGPQFVKPFITNAVKCRPPDNRTPTEIEVEACFTYLEDEVEAIDPVAIMVLGNVPLYAVTREKGGITKKAGLWERIDHPRGVPLLVLYNLHPAYVRRNPDKKDFFFECVAEFVSVWQYGLNHTQEETWNYAMP